MAFIYFAGHGVIDDSTHIMMNEAEETDRYFDLENKLYIISSACKFTYIFALMDCCR